MAIETVKYPLQGNLQPGVVEMDLKLTGAGAAAPTAASAADTDNRMLSTTLSRSGAGAYTLTLSQAGRVFLGAKATFTAASGGYQLGHASFNTTTRVLTFRIYDQLGAAADLAAADVALLTLRFKNSGAM